MFNKYIIEDGKLKETENGTASVLLFTNPTLEQQKYLINELKIDEHTLASSLDPEEPSRIEFEPNHAAVILKRPKNYSGKDQLEFKVASMGMFLYEDKLVIVLAEDLPLFIGKRFASVSGVHDIFLKLIYNSITHYLEHLRVINMISEEIEDKMTLSIDNEYLLSLLSLEKSLVYYVNAISANGFVIDRIKTYAARLNLTEQEKEFLDDIIVENNQCQKQAEIDSNILALLIGARANIVNNNLNISIKKLTAITIWLMVPTLVIGLFSVNVPIPYQQEAASFWLIICLSALSVWFSILLWKWLKW
jgi:magnesium transporter